MTCQLAERLEVLIGRCRGRPSTLKFAKRAVGSWNDDQHDRPWTEVIKLSVQASRDSVPVDDAELQELAAKTRMPFFRLANAASEAEATTELPQARDLLRQANERIGQRVRGL